MGKEKDSQETLPPHQKKKGGGIHPGLLRVNSAENEIPEREVLEGRTWACTSWSILPISVCFLSEHSVKDLGLHFMVHSSDQRVFPE